MVGPWSKSIEEATTIPHKILYAFEVAERIRTARSPLVGD